MNIERHSELPLDETDLTQNSVRKTSHLEQKNEWEIWKAFKTGDEGAFIHIYDTYFTSLYQYCQQFSNDKELIKDCIQDLFITLRKNRAGLADTNSIKLYLFKSLKRLIFRAKKRQSKFCSEEQLYESNFHLVLSHEHFMIIRQLDEDKKKNLQNALNSLPPRQKEIIYYRFYQNLNYQEICDLMEFSEVKAARNLIYRAFKSLRTKLEE